MISLTLSILSLIALGVAQNQTVSLFLPNADPQSLVGSIVGGDATATTYVVECANGGSNAAAATTDVAAATTSLGGDAGDDCGFPVPVTLVEGPSTVAYSMGVEDSTVSVNCVLSGTSVAVCTAAASGPVTAEASIPLTTTATVSGTDLSYLPVVITAGSVTNTASTPTSTTSSSTGGEKATQASGAAVHMGPAMGMGAAGALAAVAAVVL